MGPDWDRREVEFKVKEVALVQLAAAEAGGKSKSAEAIAALNANCLDSFNTVMWSYLVADLGLNIPEGKNSSKLVRDSFKRNEIFRPWGGVFKSPFWDLVDEEVRALTRRNFSSACTQAIRATMLYDPQVYAMCLLEDYTELKQRIESAETRLEWPSVDSIKSTSMRSTFNLTKLTFRLL